jgi:O-antigen/teichoic acid export membrane protein
VWRATLLQIGAKLWGGACGFLALWLLAGYLSGDAFGRYTYYLAIFVLLDSLVDMGTGHIVVQRTAADEGALPSVLLAARRLRLGSAALAAVLVAGAVLLAGEPGGWWIVLAGLYPLTHALELPAVVFRNRLAWGVPVAIRMGVTTLRLALVLLLIRLDAAGAGPFLVAAAAGSALANLGLFLAARPYLPARARSTRPAEGLFRAALPLGLAGLCQQAYFYVDNLFVRAFEGDVALGHYNVGVRILSYTTMVAVYATHAALPWFTRCHARGELTAALSRLGQPLFALACLGGGLLLPWTERLLSVFGPDFPSAGPALRWLLGAAVMIYGGSVLLTAVLATGESRAILWIAATGLLVNLVGNAWLVPTRGIEGAAIATLATEGAVAIFAAAVLWRHGVVLVKGETGWLWFAGPVLLMAAAVASALLLPG